MASSTAVRYEALLTAVKEALEVLEDGNYSHKDAREGAECILGDALEEIEEDFDHASH